MSHGQLRRAIFGQTRAQITLNGELMELCGTTSALVLRSAEEMMSQDCDDVEGFYCIVFVPYPRNALFCSLYEVEPTFLDPTVDSGTTLLDLVNSQLSSCLLTSDMRRALKNGNRYMVFNWMEILVYRGRNGNQVDRDVARQLDENLAPTWFSFFPVSWTFASPPLALFVFYFCPSDVLS